MTTDADWEPSNEVLEIALRAWRDDNLSPHDSYMAAAIKAVRPLMRDEIIAEARPEIEAEERERICKQLAIYFKWRGVPSDLALMLGVTDGALKDSKP